MLAQWIALILGNFGLAMLILALIFSLFACIFSSLSLSENLFRWMAFFALGWTGVFTFVMHAFFPAVSAANIGWAPSPFQFEVAMADLTVGVLGILALHASLGFRTATAIAAVILFWGDAIGHIYQMIINHNFASGNAGSWFLLDLILPLILLITISKMRAAQVAK